MTFDKYLLKGAYHYEWYKTEPWYRACVDRCVDFCKGSTLDLGCGEGLVCDLLEQRGYECTGIDSDKTAIALANPDLDIRQGDIEQDGFMGEWEYMVCLNTIEHLKNPLRVLDIFENFITKGAVIITDYPQEHPSKYHVKEFTPKELSDLFKDYRANLFSIDENFHGIEVYK